MTRETIIKSVLAQPWLSYKLHGLRVLQPVPNTGIVVYEVAAQREGAGSYSAD